MLVFAVGTSQTILFFLVLIIYGLGIAVIWYFISNSIKQTKLMKQQVQLLEEIARANNVSPDRISGIRNENG